MRSSRGRERRTPSARSCVFSGCEPGGRNEVFKHLPCALRTFDVYHRTMLCITAIVRLAVLVAAGGLWSLHAGMHFFHVLLGVWVSYEFKSCIQPVLDISQRAAVRLFFTLCLCRVNPLMLQTYLVFHLFYVLLGAWLCSELVFFAAEAGRWYERWRGPPPEPIDHGNVQEAPQAIDEEEESSDNESHASQNPSAKFFSKREVEMLHTCLAQGLGKTSRKPLRRFQRAVEDLLDDVSHSKVKDKGKVSELGDILLDAVHRAKKRQRDDEDHASKRRRRH